MARRSLASRSTSYSAESQQRSKRVAPPIPPARRGRDRQEPATGRHRCPRTAVRPPDPTGSARPAGGPGPNGMAPVAIGGRAGSVGGMSRRSDAAPAGPGTRRPSARRTAAVAGRADCRRVRIEASAQVGPRSGAGVPPDRRQDASVSLRAAISRSTTTGFSQISEFRKERSNESQTRDVYLRNGVFWQFGRSKIRRSGQRCDSIACRFVAADSPTRWSKPVVQPIIRACLALSLKTRSRGGW
jgi:hypothetical protein